MSWSFNGGELTGTGAINPSKELLITVVNNPIPSGTTISVLASSASTTLSGDIVNLGGSLGTFIANKSLQVFLNGQLINKTTEITWISVSEFSIPRDLQVGEEIKIFN
jgi:hypothetical protein